ncbi:MAG: hypothetical protein KIT09_18670 [Bryobacteraceae bacterium]|nr:hypothetical protein [Bryobacteraceae bacterium]
MNTVCRAGTLTAVSLLALSGSAQVVEFESGGLKYQTLTRNGLTIMFAHMPAQVRTYSIVQVAASNGSPEPVVVRPEDFRFDFADGRSIQALPALRVINELVRSANGDDVVKLVTTYEMGLYGMDRFSSTNGYEKRRQSALAVVSSTRLKAAAAASAIALVETRLDPGESTDGAVFYPSPGRLAGESRLRVYAAGRLFEFLPSAPALARK